MVFSKLNPLNLIRNFGTAGKETDRNPFPENDKTTFMDLTREIHVNILEYLDIKDLKRMRLVCHPLCWNVDNVVGLSVRLEGPKPWKDWNFTDDKRCLLAFGNPELKRVKQNINWITNSFVRGLTLSRLSGLTFDPLTLISNTYILQRLDIQFDKDTEPSVLVLKMLSTYNNLRVISISFALAGSIFRVTEEATLYHEFCQRFSEELLGTLITKPNLKEFNITANILLPFGFGRKTFLGIPPDPVGDLPKYPSTLQTLKIQLPIFTDPRKWVCWKTLLDQQIQLRDIVVHIGFPYWRIFTDIIAKNQGTLKTVDLALCNWLEGRTPENWFTEGQVGLDVVPLDWSILFPDPTQLTSLKISMSQANLRLLDFWPGGATNFTRLQFENLETLELRNIGLVAADFVHIFGNLHKLKNLSLFYWNRVNSGAFTELAREACLQMGYALVGDRFESVHMMDYSIRACPPNLRAWISAQGGARYKVSWPIVFSDHVNIGTLISGYGFTVAVNKRPLIAIASA